MIAGILPPFDQREGYIWLDGEFTAWCDARLHVLTHGLHYASVVYEGLRSYGGRVFRLDAHIERLYRSAELLNFSIPWPRHILEAATLELLHRNGTTDGYVRPVAWRGSEQMSTAAPASRIHVALACWKWPSYFDPAAARGGIAMQTAAWRRPPPSCSPAQAKASAHYMIATLSKHQALAQGYDDALMLDWRGQVAEATSANVFFVKGSALHTPRPDCFLNGITRQTVMALAREHGMEVLERTILPGELANFDECFLTGTAAEVCAVRSIDAIHYKPGAVGAALAHAYAAAVRADPAPYSASDSHTFTRRTT